MKGIVFKNLPECYRKLGYSRDDVARELNVTRATIMGYEKGNPIPFSRWRILFKFLKLDEQIYNQEYELSLQEAYSKILGVMIRSGII